MCLRLLCDSALAKHQPKLDAENPKSVLETYCNRAIADIADGMGYHKFRNKSGALTADDICKILDDDWLKISGDQAFDLSRKGTLVIAGMNSATIRAIAKLKNLTKLLNAKHGHVAVVYPSDRMLDSLSWRKKVPVLANVGTFNDTVPASRCFPAEPKYYYLPGGHPSTQGA